MFRYLKNKLLNLLTTKPRIAKTVLTVLVVFVLLSINIFVFAEQADAGFVGDLIGLALSPFVNLFANIMLFFATILGKLLVVLIDILLGIVSYNDFTNSRAVEIGWVVVRDLCNMFFIVVLLIIAFGTIFRIENYKYNRLLPKLILMAVLINFSKLIAGFLIDLGQVVMMTFVNAFADAAATNFTSAFKLRQMLGFLDGAGVGDGPSNWSLLGAPFLAIILLIVAIMVMLAMVLVFLVRIIMLWILIVLSPLAFLLEVLPGGSKYSQQWWQKFGQWVSTGPILAFFLWLSLAVLSVRDIELGVTDTSLVEGASGGGVVSAGLSAVSTSKNMVGFMFSISMMLISLSVAGSLGGIAGNAAGKMSAKVRNMGSAPFRRSASLIGRGGKALTGYIGEEIGAKLGITATRDKWKQGWQQHRESTRRKRIDDARAKASGRKGVMSTLATPEHFFDNYWGASGIKRAFQEGISGKKSTAADKDSAKAEEDYKKAQANTSELQILKDAPLESDYDDFIKKRKSIVKNIETAKESGDDDATVDVLEDKKDGVNNLRKKATNYVALLNAQVVQLERSKKTEEERAKRMPDDIPDDIKIKNQEKIVEIKTAIDKKRNEAFKLQDEIDNAGIELSVPIKLNPKWTFTDEVYKDLQATIDQMDEFKEKGELPYSEEEKVLAIEPDLAKAKKKEEEEKKRFSEAKEKADLIRPPINYEMMREQAIAASQEKAKIITDSWQEQLAVFKEAQRRGNIAQMNGAILRATEYANENEFFNSFGDKSDAQGLKSFIMNEYVGKKGFGNDVKKIREWERNNPGIKIEKDGVGISESQGLNVANLISYQAEKVGHWMVARAVGVKDGKQYWQREDDRLKEMIAEIRKLDPETFQRRVNRLGWGTEVTNKGAGTRDERAREFNTTGQRDFQNSPFALAYVMDNWKRWPELLGRGRFNESVAINITKDDNMKQMLALAAMQPASEVAKRKVGDSVENVTMREILHEIQQFGAARGGRGEFDALAGIYEHMQLTGRFEPEEKYEGMGYPPAEKSDEGIPGIG